MRARIQRVGDDRTANVCTFPEATRADEEYGELKDPGIYNKCQLKTHNRVEGYIALTVRGPRSS